MPKSALIPILALLCGAALVAACGDAPVPAASASAVPGPIADCDDAYACALRTKLPELAPENHDDLHNVFKLSDAIHSGGEPLSKEALARIAARGVKTILSVDGKVPDAATAKALGMRYVHVPIRYTGIRPDELLKIAKTFRELPGPFYVHCFHGKHRGPAAGAVGRVVLDGVSRERALAEMRQWCGAAGKYQGLYRTIAVGALPSAEETAAFAWGFDEARPFGGIRAGMVRMTRSFDQVKFAEKRGWQPDPNHPDIDVANESQKIAQAFAEMNALEELGGKPEDYQRWMKESVAASHALQTALAAVKAGEPGDTDALAEVGKHFTALKNLCAACHKPYRNHIP